MIQNDKNCFSVTKTTNKKSSHIYGRTVYELINEMDEHENLMIVMCSACFSHFSTIL